MVDSLRKSELTVNLPIKHGDLSLSLEVTNTIFSIMPFKGQHHKIASRLKEKFKCMFENQIDTHRKLSDFSRNINKCNDFLQIFGTWKNFLDNL